MVTTHHRQDVLDLTLSSIQKFAARHLADAALLDYDATDEMPVEVVRSMCGSELGLNLLFVPQEFGGLGAGAFDLYRVCEAMAHIDLGIATGVLATSLGSDPIRVGGTYEQRKRWLTRLGAEGLLVAYAATEPEAGSDLAALRTIAEPVFEADRTVAYRISGRKQWISNGGVADLYCVLALAPGGPSWFLVERDAPGLTHGKREEKHGIRASNTAAVFFDRVKVDADHLIGAVEGQGLTQAQAVFGYTRLMVAAFGLGGGWAAIDRAIRYSTERRVSGGPLAEKQGYTHKFLVPHAVRMEAARAFLEEIAARIDAGEGSLNTEGAIAKLVATEAANQAADAALQALGGYGYVREYMVEKLRRDLRITTIYEGTSEVMEMTIARDRWQLHLKTRGEHYHGEARRLETLAAQSPDCGAGAAALACDALGVVLEQCREKRLTRSQHVLMRLGDLVAHVECAASLARRAADALGGGLHPKAVNRFTPEALAAVSRLFARETAMRVCEGGLRWVVGSGDGSDAADLSAALRVPEIHAAQEGLVADMDRVADALYGRPAQSTASAPRGGPA
jgi:alkylation response protein AidB-like acyl-CoA dehydrogenase